MFKHARAGAAIACPAAVTLPRPAEHMRKMFSFMMVPLMLAALQGVTSTEAHARDKSRPSRPTNLAASAPGPTQVNLSWNASTDNVGVTHYLVFRNGSTTAIATPSGTTYSDNTVAPGTPYSYTVKAADRSGNLSYASNAAMINTPALVDVLPPSAPTALSAVAASPTQVKLSWTASTDNVGIASYAIFRNGATTPLAKSSGTSYSDTTAAAGSTYSYAVKALDAAGNVSALSNLASVTTPSSNAVNGIFLNHGFMVNPKTDAELASVVQWLAQRKFTHQFVNLTAFDANGTMNSANYSQLAHWIKVSRATGPKQKVIAYLSGSLSHVNDPSTWQNIADFCRVLTTQYGVDGINLDFEPYRPDAANYIGLFSTVRNAIGPNVQLSLDYAFDLSVSWSAADFRQVSAYFNWIMPMMYDTTCGDIACYQANIDQIVGYDFANLAPGTELFPIVPTYADSEYHKASVENICTSTAQLGTMLKANRIKIAGIGVWWYYGWDGTAETSWPSCWLNQQF